MHNELQDGDGKKTSTMKVHWSNKESFSKCLSDNPKEILVL